MKRNNTFYARIIEQLPRFSTQDKMIEYLRQFNFHFIEAKVFKNENPKVKLNIKDEKYSFMVRELEPGKNDYRLVVTVKLWGRKTERVGIYFNGKWHSRLNKIWANKEDINFKKIVIRMTFPDAMDYEERKKWRAENKKVKSKPDYQPSAFYKRWKDQVIEV